MDCIIIIIILFSKNPIPTLNPNPNPNHNSRFYQVKLENYGVSVTPDKNSSREVKGLKFRCRTNKFFAMLAGFTLQLSNYLGTAAVPKSAEVLPV